MRIVGVAQLSNQNGPQKYGKDLRSFQLNEFVLCFERPRTGVQLPGVQSKVIRTHRRSG